jgi:predicted TIM-barrel fold metal-dependent hydrolase
MTSRADAHIHLFAGGFQDKSFASRPGVSIDEVACYASLAREHDVTAALVVGYTGERWCANNNEYLAKLSPNHDWIKAVACVDVKSPPTVRDLELLRDQGFVGVSMYVFSEETQQLDRISADVWRWLDKHNWLISANSEPDRWSVWQSVLKSFPRLRLLVSHLGQPPAVTSPLQREEAASVMHPITQLANYPGVCVKLSGFYSLSSPGHDYPHTAAWPYVEQLSECFSVERLLWGSDFSPCLDWVTFPQTIDLFEMIPFLDQRGVELITGGNLLALLDEVKTDQ